MFLEKLDKAVTCILILIMIYAITMLCIAHYDGYKLNKAISENIERQISYTEKQDTGINKCKK